MEGPRIQIVDNKALHEGNESKFHWRLIAANNEILASSETYPDKSSTQDGVKAAAQAFKQLLYVTDSRDDFFQNHVEYVDE